ncbi:MAG TPA: nucleotidyl transferase AbiEii/AbiGii toxin family protein [Candidatus Cybelea sp.]|jgi:hypothetical protein|nr:nucleotidyl transferase AbiEii/AbiGii toxin family protein [Candidatus Cybelea sp.]
MTELYLTALEVQRLCEGQHWPFCIIGGVAVQRWGEPRFTKDVDLTLFTGFGEEERFLEFWLKSFQLRSPMTPAAALAHRVLFLSNNRGVPIDIAFGGTEFERRSIKRSSLWPMAEGQTIRTCSAEDLLVHKCFANRDHDWVDVDGILARQWNKLDLRLVRKELKPLAELKEEPEILNRLEQKIARHNKPFTLIKPTKPRKTRR